MCARARVLYDHITTFFDCLCASLCDCCQERFFLLQNRAIKGVGKMEIHGKKKKKKKRLENCGKRKWMCWLCRGRAKLLISPTVSGPGQSLPTLFSASHYLLVQSGKSLGCSSAASFSPTNLHIGTFFFFCFFFL